MSELKPCPWCGKQPIIQRKNNQRKYRVICSYLDCLVFPATNWKNDTAEDAIRVWNRRADNER